jgi:hypothetical protein
LLPDAPLLELPPAGLPPLELLPQAARPVARAPAASIAPARIGRPGRAPAAVWLRFPVAAVTRLRVVNFIVPLRTWVE